MPDQVAMSAVGGDNDRSLGQSCQGEVMVCAPSPQHDCTSGDRIAQGSTPARKELMSYSKVRSSSFCEEEKEVEQAMEQAQLETEYESLRMKIAAIRCRRSELRIGVDSALVCKSGWEDRRSNSEREREDAIAGYKSAVMQRQAASLSLAVSRKLCPTADCFHIWHRGPFGTINGLRLGSEAPSLPSIAVAEEDSVASGNVAAANGGPKTDFDLSSIVFAGQTQSTDQLSSAAVGNGFPEVVKVPWAEVNAALGMAALLLSTLEKKPHSGVKFHTHEIIPLGNYSKIGLMQSDGRPPVLYNLFYSDESFQFFGKRNFNTALDGLFHCLRDAANAVARIDKSIVLPHKVEISSRGEVTIGGLPIAFGVDGETWTRAMKYFLSDLKWLVAFTTKNVDR